jgi:predicted ribosome quality control (RQC) complex YloA/Tae2 family protein
MRDELSSLDIHYMVEELQVLKEGKVEKVYQWDDEDVFIIKIYASGETHNLRFKLPGVMYRTKKRFRAPRMPPGYARFLRKKLTAARIKAVRQKGFDRIVEFDIHSRRHGDLTLIYEAFKPSNLLLVDQETNKIIHPYKRQSFRDRKIESKAEYEYPPLQPDISAMNNEQLEELFAPEDRVEKTLATTFGLGGLYAQEVTERLGLASDALFKDATPTEVIAATKSLLENPEPNVVGDEAYPVRLESKPEPESVHESFSEAIDNVITQSQVIQTVKERKKQNKKKWEVIIDAQQKQIRSFQDKIEQNKAKAEYLYEHYNDFAELIYRLREARNSPERFQDLLNSLDSYVDWDPKNDTVTLSFDES